MNFKKMLQKISLLLLFIIPINTFAYSSKVIPGGENLGIHVNLNYVSIVGFYKVGDNFIGKDAGLEVGDRIIKINHNTVNSIEEMVKEIDNQNQIVLTIIRENETLEKSLNLVRDSDNVIKTGLYVKDKITGIGTLTYIDPETKIYGALGHEILDKNSSLKIEIKNGTIFKSDVVGITPSKEGKVGEKNAKFDTNESYGSIDKTSEEGIFGQYQKEFSKDEAIEVGRLEDVKLEEAILRTVIQGNEKKDYKIKILEIDKTNDTKNILFEIIDEELLKNTGGVVAGMSGSPIIQDGKVIAACTHVVVNSPKKGFAIAIENMLKEGEEPKR